MAARMTTPFRERLRTLGGVLRSLRIYHSGRSRRTALDLFYRRFVHPGDVVFDIGAHVGDRIASFRRLGARVVAVEPQPALVTTLHILFGRDRDVVIEPCAVGARDGMLALQLNVDNPTVSTASDAFIAATAGAPGWQGQRWTRSVTVPAVTLDALIARHGLPTFVKIDVEGFEAEVLAGLSQPPRALSFEFTTIQKDVARASIARCHALGFNAFNASLGESLRFVSEEWLSAEQIGAWLDGVPDKDNSGDIYAIRA
jgi:FkbM family methyltransferase